MWGDGNTKNKTIAIQGRKAHGELDNMVPVKEQGVRNTLDAIAVIGDKHTLTIYEHKFSLELDSDMMDNYVVRVEMISILLSLRA